MHAIVPLEEEPRFRPFPYGLPVESPLLRAVDDAALVLSRTKGRFDGPIAFCHGVSRDGAILRRHGRYAEAMVVFAEPSLGYRLGFALGVQLFVQRTEGPLLFQQRGPSIGRDPLLWTASASGGLSPTEHPRDAVLADAAEEIGLEESDLPGFRPIGVVVSDDTGSALIVYHATLREGAEPVPSATKVTQIHWADSPTALGAQVSADTVACWDVLQLWHERDATPA
jgi:hypothetical protein